MMRPGMNGKRILIVEDEPIIGEVCFKVFTAEGYGVEIAANGWEGKIKLNEKSYDLILIDLRMPVLDGKQLFEYISQKYPELVERVIITSGEVMGGDVKEFMETHDRPFLSKPFSPKTLKRVVQETLSKIEKCPEKNYQLL